LRRERNVANETEQMCRIEVPVSARHCLRPGRGIVSIANPQDDQFVSDVNKDDGGWYVPSDLDHRVRGHRSGQESATVGVASVFIEGAPAGDLDDAPLLRLREEAASDRATVGKRAPVLREPTQLPKDSLG
jgi:hypothetical protein